MPFLRVKTSQVKIVTVEWRARVHGSETVRAYQAQRNMNSCQHFEVDRDVGWRASVHESKRVQAYQAQPNMNSCSSHQYMPKDLKLIHPVLLQTPIFLGAVYRPRLFLLLTHIL